LQKKASVGTAGKEKRGKGTGSGQPSSGRSGLRPACLQGPGDSANGRTRHPWRDPQGAGKGRNKRKGAQAEPGQKKAKQLTAKRVLLNTKRAPRKTQEGSIKTPKKRKGEGPKPKNPLPRKTVVRALLTLQIPAKGVRQVEQEGKEQI